ncbi:MAG: hypothetical protein AAGK04_14880, partial [Planctomycetota bacterium]
MKLLYVGIDEAGYGPMLGPLCVGLAGVVIDTFDPAGGAPDLWERLRDAVCKAPRDKARRIAINDSKALKLSNQGKRHPLTHLERGVLSALGGSISTDAELFDALGAKPGEGPWYGGPELVLPLASTSDAIGLDANRLSHASANAGIRFVDLRCHITSERAFNAMVRETGTKAATTASAFMAALKRVAASDEARGVIESGGAVRVVCDRLGGRLSYIPLLERAGTLGVRSIEESPRACVYDLSLSGTEMRVVFMPEADAGHLPVALASMIAKLVRELMMLRFNRYWSARMPELKPTAGYTTDARRWLADAGEILTDAERKALVRAGTLGVRSIEESPRACV